MSTMPPEAFIDPTVSKKEGFISTGIEKLDRLLEGGIPNGFTTILFSTPGSSVELLIKQLALMGNVTYITTEETQEEIMDTMRRFSWKTPDIEFIDISSKYYSTSSKENKKESASTNNDQNSD